MHSSHSHFTPRLLRKTLPNPVLIVGIHYIHGLRDMQTKYSRRKTEQHPIFNLLSVRIPLGPIVVETTKKRPIAPHIDKIN